MSMKNILDNNDILYKVEKIMKNVIQLLNLLSIIIFDLILTK